MEHHFSGKCFYCGKVCHWINEYHSKNAAEEKAKVAIDEEKDQKNKKFELMFDSTIHIDHNHVCTINGKTFFVFTKNTWIGNTGGSCQITNYDNDMFDVKTVNETVHRSSRTIKTN